MPCRDKKIGFAGAGAMGAAMIGSLIKAGIFDPSSIFIHDIDAGRMDDLKSRHGIWPIETMGRLFSISDIFVLAVKPQVFDPVLASIVSGDDYKITGRKLAISIAAGVSLKKIEAALYAPLSDSQRANLPIMRVMPNTPALVSEGMSGACGNRHVTDPDKACVKAILGAMGESIEFDETDMDAVTAVSGSGPAYVFYIMESMIKAGVGIGLEREDAEKLVVQTFKGAVALMEKSGETPDALRAKVTSPGGTTEAAVAALNHRGVDGWIGEAVKAAWARSKELMAS